MAKLVNTRAHLRQIITPRLGAEYPRQATIYIDPQMDVSFFDAISNWNQTGALTLCFVTEPDQPIFSLPK